MNDDTRDDGDRGRRDFLKCMAWAGTGALWMMHGGVLRARELDTAGTPARADAGAASYGFVQISDSHIGFDHPPYTDVVGSLRACIARINAQTPRPDFVVHTGDLTHLSRPEQFDTVAQLLGEARTGQVFYVPGEHDVIGDNGKEFFRRFRAGTGATAGGWYSFDHKGTHFVALVNVLNLRAGGMGQLGADQLAWLRQDLAARSSSTPIVVLAHMPLWALYPAWGWGTDDGAQALDYLQRFGSATVLNGHVHQIQQTVEGRVTFYTARSTAYPQPAPGVGPGPGPRKDIADGQLPRYLGVREVRQLAGTGRLAVTDHALAG